MEEKEKKINTVVYAISIALLITIVALYYSGINGIITLILSLILVIILGISSYSVISRGLGEDLKTFLDPLLLIVAFLFSSNVFFYNLFYLINS